MKNILNPEEDSQRRVWEDIEAEGRRVLRGGSFGYRSDFVRCAARFDLVAGYRGGDSGFRVVVSPFFSER